MTRSLQQEIKQRVPFTRPEGEAVLNLLRTADRFNRHLQQVLKPYGITPTQYNALRILRGAGKEGLTCGDLGERLVSHDPDITRLLDRLARQRLIQRHRGAKDRRVVLSGITAAGLGLLVELDPVLENGIRAALRHMSPQRIEQMTRLMEEARAGLVEDAAPSNG